MTPPKGEILALTGLRAVAAVWVFGFHLHIRAPIVDGPLAAIFQAGAAGMTVFFVLSGFVLTLACRDGPDLRRFARARMARIYPLYALAAVMALPWLLSSDQSPLAIATTVLISGLVLQAWFPNLFNIWNHASSWSLSVEAALYTAFPAVRHVLHALPEQTLIWVILTTMIFSGMIAGTYYIFPNGPGFAFQYATPIFRLPEFMAGVAFGHLALRGVQVPGWLPMLGVLAFATLMIGVEGQGLPTMWAPLLIPVVGMAVLHLTHTPNGLLSARPVVWFGRISYAFYLFQFHVILGLPRLVDLSAPSYWLVTIVLTLIIATAAHYLVERPARLWLLRTRPLPRGRPA